MSWNRKFDLSCVTNQTLCLSLFNPLVVSYSPIDTLHSAQLVISCRKKGVTTFARPADTRTITVYQNRRQPIVFGYTWSVDYDDRTAFQCETIRSPICIKRKVSIDRERPVICNYTCGKFGRQCANCSRWKQLQRLLKCHHKDLLISYNN